MDQNKGSINSFGSLKINQIIKENEHFVVVHDKYPVSPGHTLIIAKRSITRFSELSKQEKFDLIELVDWAVCYLEKNLKPKPDSFNLGINDGVAAGQTIGQFHYHVIPRYTGDVADPRGGIRFVIPSKGKYED
jgi:diadenosine tetraphosphate (Ap4A) HIT family hydrolase